MNISKTHQHFSDRLNNPRALDHPEEFLGENWKDVLNFWFYLDTLSEEQWKIIIKRYNELDDNAWNAAFESARDAGDAARVVSRAVWDAARIVTWDAWYAAWTAQDAAWVAATGLATSELICSHTLFIQNKPLTFLPMFLDL